MATIAITQIITAEMLADEERASQLRPLTCRQVKLGLLSIGITGAMVDARIDAIEDEAEREYARIEWQEAGTINRGHPLVDDLAVAFALPDEQVDALWIWAAGL